EGKCGGRKHREARFLPGRAPEKGNSRPREWAVFLLFTADRGPHAVPGSRAAAGANGGEFVSKSGFLLRGVQQPQGREGGEGFLARLVSGAKIVHELVREPPPRPRSLGQRQTPPRARHSRQISHRDGATNPPVRVRPTARAGECREE